MSPDPIALRQAQGTAEGAGEAVVLRQAHGAGEAAALRQAQGAIVGAGEAVEGPEPSRVEVFGVRHHGPGSARSLVAALQAYQPDSVLIEGPADADPLLRWVLAEEMEPPLALLGYAPDEPKIAAFWPYAVFSPEWQAMTWAVRHDVETAFCDLPAAMVLAPRTKNLLDDDEPNDEDDDQGQEADADGWASRKIEHDPLGALAKAAGYDDAERWWDDLVETRLDGSSPFPMITEAMAEMRPAVLRSLTTRSAIHEARREAYMRQTIRAATRRGRQRIAVVCGAWHAPALMAPLPPAAHDARVLRGTPKRKVVVTWVPWTHERLASATGYGAGITSPGWYHHLWTAPDQPIARWLTKVARALRSRDLPTSSAHVIEAVRLAETLASLRGRPLAGLDEVTEATRSVLCDGDEVAVRYVTDELVVGQALGSVNPGVPTVPLEADLVKTCRPLLIRRQPVPRTHDLDLRRSIDQARSRLFHRLRLLDLDWIRPAESSVEAQGTFRETWASCWRPEYAIAVVEASVWGTTVEAAATARVERISQDGSLLELTEAVGRCLLAQLPEALDRLLEALAERAAMDADVVHLMDALLPLARAQRYGDVRQTDTAALRQVAEVLVVRICAGLSNAVAGLDADEAVGMRRRVDRVSEAIGLLAESEAGARSDNEAGPEHELRGRWTATLRSLVDRFDLQGVLIGRIVRLLVDAGELDDVAVRVERALSHGVEAGAKAGWVDGFFADGAVLLIHDNQLRGLLDRWVASLDDAEFVDLLPLVRRTFGTFSSAERRALAGRIDAGDAALARATADGLDPERVAIAMPTVEQILGGAR